MKIRQLEKKKKNMLFMFLYSHKINIVCQRRDTTKTKMN